jgi:hypothetical protein
MVITVASHLKDLLKDFDVMDRLANCLVKEGEAVPMFKW